MKQEKQKVIRVLKPTQKSKKIPRIYFGVAAIAVGVLSVSALLFSSSQEVSDHIAAPQTHATAQDQLNSQSDSALQLDPSDTEQATDASQNDANHEEFNEPQPKLNEITNIFKHQKQVTVQENSSASPFDRAMGEPKVALPAAKATPTKTAPATAATKSNTAKTTEPAKIIAKPADKNITVADTATVVFVPAKAKEPIKDAEVESPRATVQITVTKSVKEN